jgi:hypothetical protein
VEGGGAFRKFHEFVPDVTICPEDDVPQTRTLFRDGSKKKLNHRDTEKNQAPCLRVVAFCLIYSVAGLAQERLVREAMRSGISMSLFQASRHALRMAS